MKTVTPPLAIYHVVQADDEQSSGNASLLRKWAREGGSRVTWVVDEWDPDESIDEREGLRALLQLLRWRKVVGVVVVNRDVFGPDPVVQELVSHEVKEAGGELIELRELAGQLDAERELIRRTIDLVRTHDARIVQDRLRSGRATKAVQGGYAYGAPGYGYQARHGQLRALEKEQAAIARMIDLRKQGLSYRAIAQRLKEEGLTPKRGKEWHPESVRRVLRRESLAA